MSEGVNVLAYGNELGAKDKRVANQPCSTSNLITGGKRQLSKSEVVRMYGRSSLPGL